MIEPWGSRGDEQLRYKSLRLIAIVAGPLPSPEIYRLQQLWLIAKTQDKGYVGIFVKSIRLKPNMYKAVEATLMSTSSCWLQSVRWAKMF